MNRVKISLPPLFNFSTKIIIRVTDLNYGGHVGNDSFLSLIHEARQQFLISHGYKELAIEGYGLIMADVAIAFKKELNYGDTVKISVAAEGFDKLGFDLFYKLELVKEDEYILAGEAKTGMISYDYIRKTKIAIPEVVINKLSQ